MNRKLTVSLPLAVTFNYDVCHIDQEVWDVEELFAASSNVPSLQQSAEDIFKDL